MATRAQIQMIEREGTQAYEKVTLYKHFDGYPSEVLAVLDQAYSIVSNPEHRWKLGRAGKAASLLCSVEPGEIEPEEGHELHGDIDFYYQVHVSEKTWRIKVFTVDDGVLNLPPIGDADLTRVGPLIKALRDGGI